MTQAIASRSGGNKARVSVQERIDQLVAQGVPLAEATEQANREAVAATEVMLPTTVGDAPTDPPSGVTTAVTFGNGSTGTSAGPSSLLSELHPPGSPAWAKARRDYLDELNRALDDSREQYRAAVIGKAEGPEPVGASAGEPLPVEGVGEDAQQEINGRDSGPPGRSGDGGFAEHARVAREHGVVDPLLKRMLEERLGRELTDEMFLRISNPGSARPGLSPVELDALEPDLTPLTAPAPPTVDKVPFKQRAIHELTRDQGDLGFRLLQTLGNVGGAVAGGRAIQDANRQDQSSQARANLINALSSRAVARGTRTQPSLGLLGQLSSGLAGIGEAGLQHGELRRKIDQQEFLNRETTRLTDARRAGKGTSGSEIPNLTEGQRNLMMDQLRNATGRTLEERAGNARIDLTAVNNRDRMALRRALFPEAAVTPELGDFTEALTSLGARNPEADAATLLSDSGLQIPSGFESAAIGVIRNAQDKVEPPEPDEPGDLEADQRRALTDNLRSLAQDGESLDAVLDRNPELSTRFNSLGEADQGFVRDRFAAPVPIVDRVPPRQAGAGTGTFSDTGKMNMVDSQLFGAQVAQIGLLFGQQELRGDFLDRALLAFGLDGIPVLDEDQNGSLSIGLFNRVFQEQFPASSHFRQMLGSFAIQYASAINNGRPTKEDQEAAMRALPVKGEKYEIQVAKMRMLSEISTIRSIVTAYAYTGNSNLASLGFVDFGLADGELSLTGPQLDRGPLLKWVRDNIGNDALAEVSTALRKSDRMYAEPGSADSADIGHVVITTPEEGELE